MGSARMTAAVDSEVHYSHLQMNEHWLTNAGEGRGRGRGRGGGRGGRDDRHSHAVHGGA